MSLSLERSVRPDVDFRKPSAGTFRYAEVRRLRSVEQAGPDAIDSIIDAAVEDKRRIDGNADNEVLVGAKIDFVTALRRRVGSEIREQSVDVVFDAISHATDLDHKEVRTMAEEQIDRATTKKHVTIHVGEGSKEVSRDVIDRQAAIDQGLRAAAEEIVLMEARTRRPDLFPQPKQRPHETPDHETNGDGLDVDGSRTDAESDVRFSSAYIAQRAMRELGVVTE
jgi:hypothetical protein